MRRKEFNVIQKQAADRLAKSIEKNEEVTMSGLTEFLLIDLCEQQRETNKLLRRLLKGKGKKK